MSAPTIPSPCISVCSMDDASGFCKGCFRTLDEVKSWLYYTDNQKQGVINQLEKRKRVCLNS